MNAPEQPLQIATAPAQRSEHDDPRKTVDTAQRQLDQNDLDAIASDRAEQEKQAGEKKQVIDENTDQAPRENSRSGVAE